MDAGVCDREVGLDRPAVVEVASALEGNGVVARGEPDLRLGARPDLAGRPRPAHPRPHPAGIDRRGDHVGPEAGDRGGQHRVEELRISVGLVGVPRPALPPHVCEVRIARPVHAGAEVDQPLRALDNGRQEVRRQDVDLEDVLEAVLGLQAALAVTDARVVDDRVERAGGVDPAGQLARARDRGEVARERRSRARNAAHRRPCPRRVASVQDHLVTRLDELPGRLATQTVGRTRDQHPRHQTSTEPPSTVRITPR